MKGQSGFLIESQDRSIPFHRRLTRNIRGTRMYHLEPRLQFLNKIDCVEAYINSKWVEATPTRIDYLGGFIELPKGTEAKKVRVSGEAYPIFVIGTLPVFEIYTETREVFALTGTSSACTLKVVGSAAGYSTCKSLREAAAFLYIHECLRLSCFIRFEEELRRGSLTWEKVYFTCDDVRIQAAPWPLPL